VESISGSLANRRTAPATTPVYGAFFTAL